jgi:hypothetical protein
LITNKQLPDVTTKEVLLIDKTEAGLQVPNCSIFSFGWGKEVGAAMSNVKYTKTYTKKLYFILIFLYHS